MTAGRSLFRGCQGFRYSQWAVANGIDVGKRGRIPAHVVRKYVEYTIEG
jgi:hypothetical protein